MLACRNLCLSTLLLRSLITSPPQTNPRFSLCRPWDCLWDFFVFRPFLWDVWENRGEGVYVRPHCLSRQLSAVVGSIGPKPGTRRPKPEARLWDFSLFRPFLWDVWENRGRGSGRLATRNSALGTQHSELGTRNSELGTGLPTFNLQPTTFNCFSPGYPGLVC
jgi:hypothetical protein